MYRHIVISTDGSELSGHALDQALALASKLGAKVTVMTVIESYGLLAYAPEQLIDTRAEYEQQAREYAAQVLTDAADKAKALGVACETLLVENENPYEAIIAAARDRGADLIAMGSHGRRGISGLVLGSVTVKVLTHSTVPVLVYRQAAS